MVQAQDQVIDHDLTVSPGNDTTARLTGGLLYGNMIPVSNGPMPKTISPSARFAAILEHCPPGQYSIREVSDMTGITYGMIQHLFNKHRHPRIKSPHGIRGRASRTVTVLPPIVQRRSHRQGGHCDHKLVVIPPDQPWPSDLTASLNPGTQPPKGS